MPEDVSAQSISVLIRTFNSDKTLNKVLSRILLKAGDEIVIVDSGSTDGTLRTVRRYHTVLVQAPLPFNYSKSLNAGFSKAKNPWVLVLSSHSLPVVPDLLAVYRPTFELLPADVVAVYGSSFADFGEKFPCEDLTFYSTESFSQMYRFCSNQNTLYRREAWEKCSFDEELRTAEDKAWAENRLKAGYKIGALPQAAVLSVSRYPLRYMFKKGYSEMLAIPHRKITWIELFRKCRALLKRPFLYRMPFQTWIRTYAVLFGAFCASRKPQENRPWKQ